MNYFSLVLKTNTKKLSFFLAKPKEINNFTHGSNHLETMNASRIFSIHISKQIYVICIICVFIFKWDNSILNVLFSIYILL